MSYRVTLRQVKCKFSKTADTGLDLFFEIRESLHFTVRSSMAHPRVYLEATHHAYGSSMFIVERDAARVSNLMSVPMFAAAFLGLFLIRIDGNL